MAEVDDPDLSMLLRQGARVKGISDGTSTIVASVPKGSYLTEIIYRSQSDNIRSVVMANDEIKNRLSPARDHDGPTFDADPRDFKLAAEAMRISRAAEFDPVAAVHSSNVEPLPHQIRAVYEELLPRLPLRFLLADDPGAGKTIMAGLYIKELRLRSSLDRCLIVAPGSLVEQWQEELHDKFELRFELLTNQLIQSSLEPNFFSAHPFLIARMDQLARNDALIEQLEQTQWDLAVVDEAHRMSAHYSSFGGELKPTKRFRLGQVLSATARNFLLMTATPHSGNEDDFQAFMSLLDPDRFAGKYRPGVHRTDTRGLMRRMVKEELLTFEGKPLFPERRAETINYTLSAHEMGLYERVTEYVRNEMNRAEQIGVDGDKRRAGNVGFALTMLQRRLASSPEAILRSLERRRDRLTERLKATQERVAITEITGRDEVPLPGMAGFGKSHIQQRFFETDQLVDASIETNDFEDFDDLDNDVTDAERERYEDSVEEVVDLATAARTVEELRFEIDVLESLVADARRVRYAGEDRKWNELRSILQDQQLTAGVQKIIIFTEHKDTVNYLVGQIRNFLGDDAAVVRIDGSVRRDERRAIQTSFSEDPRVRVLVATDAAGEGLNLQRAHLMVNYDLPWNPNRIEQRFGRIHRIGQREVCFLWNLVASETREGAVFERLLEKIGEQRKAYNGNLFNVLGEGNAFDNKPLRDLLVEAIRRGNDPEVRAYLDQVIDAGVSQGLREIAQREALYADVRDAVDIESIRDRMDRARERRLQPGFIRDFFLAAFRELGGRISEREQGRYEILRVPERVRDHARQKDRWATVAERYERVTFESSLVAAPEHIDGAVDATLLAPGQPLLNAVIDLTLLDKGDTLLRGATLVDATDSQSDTPTLLFAVEQSIQNAVEPPQTVDQYLTFLEAAPDHTASVSNLAPYLDYDPPQQYQASAAGELRQQQWVHDSHEEDVADWSVGVAMQERLPELQVRTSAEVERVRIQVHDRLIKEANYWENEARDREDKVRAGKILKSGPQVALRRADDARRRLEQRSRELDLQKQLNVLPPRIRGVALVVPSALLPAENDDVVAPDLARETKRVERRAVDAVMRVERLLGRDPHEMPFNNKGFDIRSHIPGGGSIPIEVKGRIAGARDFMITASEINFSQAQGDAYILALVEVSAEGPEHDQVRYVRKPFEGRVVGADQTKIGFEWQSYWSRGSEPS